MRHILFLLLVIQIHTETIIKKSISLCEPTDQQFNINDVNECNELNGLQKLKCQFYINELESNTKPDEYYRLSTEFGNVVTYNSQQNKTFITKCKQFSEIIVDDEYDVSNKPGMCVRDLPIIIKDGDVRKYVYLTTTGVLRTNTSYRECYKEDICFDIGEKCLMNNGNVMF